MSAVESHSFSRYGAHRGFVQGAKSAKKRQIDAPPGRVPVGSDEMGGLGGGAQYEKS